MEQQQWPDIEWDPKRQRYVIKPDYFLSEENYIYTLWLEPTTKCFPPENKLLPITEHKIIVFQLQV